MNLRTLGHRTGQTSARSLMYLGIAIAVTVIILVLYKVLIVHFQVEDFTAQVKGLQSRLDKVQEHLHTSERSTSLVELERVLAVLNEISSEAPPGPVKDQTDALKIEVVSLVEELRKETAPEGVPTAETFPDPPENTPLPAESEKRYGEISGTPVPPPSDTVSETLGITGEGPVENLAEPTISSEPAQSENLAGDQVKAIETTASPEAKVEESAPEMSPVPEIDGLKEGVEAPTPSVPEP